MAFEKFENRHTRVEERITLTRSHTIGFPSRFYHDNNIKDFKYAVLFWDADAKEIGILFTNNEAEKKNGFAIARSKEGYGGSVIARSFFKHYRIEPEIVHGRYPWRKVHQEGIGDIFVISLTKNQ